MSAHVVRRSECREFQSCWLVGSCLRLLILPHGAGDWAPWHATTPCCQVAQVAHGAVASVGLDPGVGQQLDDGGALQRVLLQRALDEVARELAHGGGEARRLHADLLLNRTALLVVEGRKAHQQLVRQHAHCPGVHCEVVVQVLLLLVFLGLVLEGAVEHLGGHVLQGTCTSDCALLAQVNGKPKVTKLERHGPGKQHVLGLDVTVHDAVLVQVVEHQQEGVQH
mmetsp:Transcript_9292/g.19855  ORF Transcript_9292/g.19855 Transcript_9292/m.19855 type:complete len:224 (+) Transcript_9292:1984-2655(+)